MSYRKLAVALLIFLAALPAVADESAKRPTVLNQKAQGARAAEKELREAYAEFTRTQRNFEEAAARSDTLWNQIKNTAQGIRIRGGLHVEPILTEAQLQKGAAAQELYHAKERLESALAKGTALNLPGVAGAASVQSDYLSSVSASRRNQEAIAERLDSIQQLSATVSSVASAYYGGLELKAGLSLLSAARASIAGSSVLFTGELASAPSSAALFARALGYGTYGEVMKTQSHFLTEFLTDFEGVEPEKEKKNYRVTPLTPKPPQPLSSPFSKGPQLSTKEKDLAHYCLEWSMKHELPWLLERWNHLGPQTMGLTLKGTSTPRPSLDRTPGSISESSDETLSCKITSKNTSGSCSQLLRIPASDVAKTPEKMPAECVALGQKLAKEHSNFYRTAYPGEVEIAAPSATPNATGGGADSAFQ